jgi:hypothetical protein
MPFSIDLPGGIEDHSLLFKVFFFLTIREGLGNKMRVENNDSILGRWVSCPVISLLGLGI